jgi:hypothetical protein
MRFASRRDYGALSDETLALGDAVAEGVGVGDGFSFERE